MQAPVRIAAPAAEILMIEEVRRQLLISHEEWDAELHPLIGAATGILDGWGGKLGRCLIRQTWRQAFPCWSRSGRMRLPFPALQLGAVTYLDGGVEATVPPEDLLLLEDPISPYVAWAPDTWRPAHDRRDDAIRITFDAGYGDAAADVPQPIRSAALMLIAHWWRRREAAGEADLKTVPLGVEALLHPFRRVHPVWE